MKDVAYHLPDRFVERRAVSDLDEASVGEQVVVALSVVEHRSSPSARAPYRVLAQDSKGNVCALTYFGKAVHELTLPEIAYLAAVPKAPGNYDPYKYPERATERRNYVLSRMADEGYITTAEADEANRAKSSFLRWRSSNTAVRSASNTVVTWGAVWSRLWTMCSAMRLRVAV